MLEIPAVQNKKYVCIVLHGLGASSNDLFPLAPALWPNPHVHWMFLDAPIKAVSINAGLKMPAWYDVKNMDLEVEQDQVGINNSYEQIKAVIDKEKSNGITTKNIVLVGFSQGGAMALYTTLTYQEKFLATVALSAYLPLINHFDTVTITDTPIFLGAGQLDFVVPIDKTNNSSNKLQDFGFTTKLQIYPNLAHGIIPQEIEDVAKFLNEQI